MRFAVLGCRGLLGSDLLSSLESSEHQGVGFDRGDLDIRTGNVREALAGFDVVVNTAAYTSVDLAESNWTEVNDVNAVSAGRLAHAAQVAGARFIQISTDYVFSGDSDVAYAIEDLPNPKTAYGRSKAMGEVLVSKSSADYAIIRTAWLYGAAGKCFPKVLGNALQTQGVVEVVADQFGQPTWTKDLARVIIECSQLERMPRIVHGVASGKATWAEFAKEIALAMNFDPEKSIVEVDSKAYPTIASRPKWSVLDNSSELIHPIGHWRDRWKAAAHEVLTDLNQ